MVSSRIDKGVLENSVRENAERSGTNAASLLVVHGDVRKFEHLRFCALLLAGVPRKPGNGPPSGGPLQVLHIHCKETRYSTDTQMNVARLYPFKHIRGLKTTRAA